MTEKSTSVAVNIEFIEVVPIAFGVVAERTDANIKVFYFDFERQMLAIEISGNLVLIDFKVLGDINPTST